MHPSKEYQPFDLLCSVFILQVAEVAQILDFLSTQTALPIVGISGGSAVVIPYKVSTVSTTREDIFTLKPGFASSPLLSPASEPVKHILVVR